MESGEWRVRLAHHIFFFYENRQRPLAQGNEEEATHRTLKEGRMDGYQRDDVDVALVLRLYIRVIVIPATTNTLLHACRLLNPNNTILTVSRAHPDNRWLSNDYRLVTENKARPPWQTTAR